MDLKETLEGRKVAGEDIPKAVSYIQIGGQDIPTDIKDMTIVEILDAKLEGNLKVSKFQI